MTEVWTRENPRTLTPRRALEILKEGHRRFRANVRKNRDLRAQRKRTVGGQFPFAFILSCIDSRTPPELIFDLGIGEVFTARVAGHVLNEDILGSMEFACQVVGTPLIVVLGHTRCGAIKGACEGVELGHLTQLVRKIAPAREAVCREHGVDRITAPELIDRVAERHVLEVVREIPERSALLRRRLVQGRMAVVGAMYELETGQVRFLN